MMVKPLPRVRRKIVLLASLATLILAGCEPGGTGHAGVGTMAGAAAGAGVGRAIFRDNTTGMLIGGAVGGLAGNAMVDRLAEIRRQQEIEASRDTAMRRRLDYERQRALQQEEVRRQIEEQRLFEQWMRERNASS